MPYYHNPTKKMVSYVPDKPMVDEIMTKPNKRNKIPTRKDWFVRAEIEITRADNFLKPGTCQWYYPTSEYPKENYPPTDSKEQVVSWFKMNHLPKMGNVISEEEYHKLKRVYEAEARKNTPPK